MNAKIVIALIVLAGVPTASRPVPKDPGIDIDRLRLEMPGITETCLRRIEAGGFDAFPQSADECFEMTPPQRWKGVWRREFEGMQFCPAPAKDCGAGSGPTIWLDLPEVKGEMWPARRYEIEFIGRRTQHPGGFGHMGMSDHEMIVDKLISIKPLSDERD